MAEGSVLLSGLETKCRSVIKVTSREVDEEAEEVVEDGVGETAAAAETNNGHET